MVIDAEKPAELPDLPPQYQRAFSPVGALLNPADEVNEYALARNDTEAVPHLLEAGAAESEQRTTSHKIVDGDTLTALAERYLGSSQRWAELFEHNRGVIKSPDLLPIGRILQIPAATAAPGIVSPQLEPVPKMTPLPRGAFQRNP
jgi:LysM repeat protein